MPHGLPRRVQALGLAIFCLPQLAFAQNKPLPIFSFQGQDTETVYDVSPKTHPESCWQGNPQTVIRCASASKSFAGGPFDKLDRYYNNSRLYIVVVFFEYKRYDDVVGALELKYGQPASEGVRYKIRDNHATPRLKTLWHFRGGDLELNSVGPKPGLSSLTFFSLANAPSVERPTVDF